MATLAAWRLLSGVVDLGGWAPGPPADDWAAIADAARVNAICCAYAALRHVRGSAVSIETGGVPIDASGRRQPEGPGGGDARAAAGRGRHPACEPGHGLAPPPGAL